MLHSSGEGVVVVVVVGGIRIVNNHDAGDHSIHWLITAHMPNGGHQRASHNFYWSQFWWEIAAAARSAIACYGGVDSHRGLITQLMARRPRVRQALNWILISQRILTIYCFRGRKMWNYDLLHMITLAPSCIENVEAIESDCCGIGLAFLQLVCTFWRLTLLPCSLPLFNENR